MHEWWSKHFELLIKCKLNKKDMEKVVNSKKIKFRDGVLKFLDMPHEHNIPLIIMSSSGLGGDAQCTLRKREDCMTTFR